MIYPSYVGEFRYASTRLCHSLVMRDNLPFYVVDSDIDNMVFHGYEPLTGRYSDSTLEQLSTKPVSLGFVNVGDSATFASRTPIRNYKQGLTKNSIAFYKGKQVSIDSLALGKTVIGEYPDLMGCAERVDCDKHDAVAFSRNFAVTKDKFGKSQFGLSYRGIPVGKGQWVDQADTVVFALDDNRKFLFEMLEEAINGRV